MFSPNANLTKGQHKLSRLRPLHQFRTRLLEKAGTVDYYCRFHPNMKATLKIEP